MFNTPINTPFNNNCMAPQQRMEQLVSQHPQYFSQNVQQALNTSTGWKVMPVSNIQEANATPADLYGNPIFFINRAQGEIYMKQLDQTGAAPLITFIMKPQDYQVKLSEEQKQPINEFHNDLRKLTNKIDDIHKVLVSTQVKETKQKEHKNQ